MHLDQARQTGRVLAGDILAPQASDIPSTLSNFAPMTIKPITVLLSAARDGDASAMDQVYSAAYEELRKLAQSHRRRWRGNNTLNATALISEVFIKLAGDKEPDFASRTHFFATASRAMRQVLVNYAEQQGAAKRGGDAVRITLDEEKLAGDTTIDELLDLHEMLLRLETENPRRCQIVECRIFGGMTIDEVAEALSISPATVKREWQVASARIFLELKKN